MRNFPILLRAGTTKPKRAKSSLLGNREGVGAEGIRQIY